MIISKEYENYISKMKNNYEKVKDNINKDYKKSNYSSKLNLLSRNNEPIRKYLNDMIMGTCLKDDDENLKAINEIYKTHSAFMKYYFDLIGWEIIK